MYCGRSLLALQDRHEFKSFFTSPFLVTVSIVASSLTTKLCHTKRLLVGYSLCLQMGLTMRSPLHALLQMSTKRRPRSLEERSPDLKRIWEPMYLNRTT